MHTKYYCIFCGQEIYPEAATQKNDRGKAFNVYIFQCENIVCQATYESLGTHIPKITILHKPNIQELNFDED